MMFQSTCNIHSGVSSVMPTQLSPHNTHPCWKVRIGEMDYDRVHLLLHFLHARNTLLYMILPTLFIHDLQKILTIYLLSHGHTTFKLRFSQLTNLMLSLQLYSRGNLCFTYSTGWWFNRLENFTEY